MAVPRARFSGNEDKTDYGRRPNGLYVPRFRNVTSKSRGFLRGYGFQGSGFRERWQHGLDTPGFGADFKHALRNYGSWKLRFYGFGECLPSENNYVTIDPVAKDKWGIPALRVHMTWAENERALLEDAAVTAAEVLNGHNQAHDVPNLFVTDGACMTSSSCVNPSITYMVLTARL